MQEKPEVDFINATGAGILKRGVTLRRRQPCNTSWNCTPIV